jgi:ribosome-binding factor A
MAGQMKSKFCPVLHFYEDENFKKTLETMKLIDQAVGEIKENTEEQTDENKV